MKRKVVFLIICVGLVILTIGIIRFFKNRGGKTGVLQIESIPSASVFLNNSSGGKTPYKQKVNQGEYTVRIVPETTTQQFAEWQGNIKVGNNILTYVSVILGGSDLTTSTQIAWLEKITSKLSELSVVTDPDGATVIVDDVTRGITPLAIQDISTGEHVISVSSGGYQTRTLNIRTTPGYRLIANFKLALAEGGSASPSPTLTQGTASAIVQPKTSPSQIATKSGTVQADSQKPYVVIKDTPTGFLRVRMEPTTSATEAARVKPGEKYTIVDIKSNWYEINYDGTNTGWVSGQYVDKVE